MPDQSDPQIPVGTTTDADTDTNASSTPAAIDRRNFIKIMGGALGGVALLSMRPLPTADATPIKPPSYFCVLPDADTIAVVETHSQGPSAVAASLAKYVDPLPIPSVLQPTGKYQGMPLYEVSMRQFTQKLHRDLPPTKLWGYNSVFPGPTFEVEQNQPIAVRWQNKLPATHLFPLDNTLHGDEPGTPDVRTVVHLHGAKVLPEYDGYPEAWFTKDFAQTGPTYSTQIYKYSNEQDSTALWYHDHALGLTRVNVYAGLAGFYLIRSDKERALRLPSGDFEIPLVIQDRTFNPDGSLFYPTNTNNNPSLPPVWVGEFFGDTILVNGKVWPYLEVEPRKYRFRILNGSNARFYHLRLRMGDDTPPPLFNIIGTDLGFLSEPVKRGKFLIAPAERFDVVIDFSGFENRQIVLHNNAKASYPNGTSYIPNQVMLFKVKSKTSGTDKSVLPSKLYTVPALKPSSAVTTRDINLTAGLSPTFMWMMNNAHWDDAVTENPAAGTTEIWRIINKGGVAHPFHIHLVRFQVLDRQPVALAQTSDELAFSGPPELPPVDESRAWKDTVIANAHTVTRVIAKFDLPKNADTTPGTHHRYVYHCHMIEHEDNEMMRPYDVVS